MKLTSYGAAGEVTGSCHHISVGEKQILLDCGLIQGRRMDELRNHDPFPFQAADIDAVILSHAHIDHCGRLPMLLRQGYRGRIYTHEASADLLDILLKDSAKLNERDVEYENKKRKKKDLPPLDVLYQQHDVENTLKRVHTVAYRTWQQACEGVRFRLHDAGHIIGSAMVELELSEAGETRTLVFSGDLGHRGAPILRDFRMLENADFVLMESTYGDRLHRPWEDTLVEVEGIIESLREQKGNVLIPAFAVGRSQMILYTLARNYAAWEVDRWRIFLDSPMAIEASQVYLKHTALYDENAAEFYRDNGALLAMPNLRFTRTAEESREINEIESGALIIAGSGMMTGGRILHHLKHNLWREDAHVIVAGYQGHGTLGRLLVEGADEVKIYGDRVPVRASIHTVGGLSAHADQQGLCDWYANFTNRPPVLLVHGEDDAMQTLAERLRRDYGAWAQPANRGRSTDLLALDRLNNL